MSLKSINIGGAKYLDSTNCRF